VREEEEYENGEGVIHSRTYDYIILPQKNGRFDVRPVLHYFDPDSSRYISKTLEAPVQIVVEPGKSISREPLVDALEQRRDRPASFLEWLSVHGWWLFPVLVGAGIGAWITFRRRSRSKDAGRTAVQAPSPVKENAADLAALRMPMGCGDAVLFYDRLYRALFSQLGTRFGLPPAQWSAPVLTEQMRLRGYRETDVEDVRFILSTCEQVLFAGQDRSAQMADVLRKAEAVLTSLSKFP
jgi:hypothetical protein